VNKVLLSKECYYKGIKRLSQCFPNVQPTEEALDVWYDFLNEFNDRDFTDGVEKICREMDTIYKDMNVVAVIRKNIETREMYYGDSPLR